MPPRTIVRKQPAELRRRHVASFQAVDLLYNELVE
jgi:hypothetical protein